MTDGRDGHGWTKEVVHLMPMPAMDIYTIPRAVLGFLVRLLNHVCTRADPFTTIKRLRVKLLCR